MSHSGLSPQARRAIKQLGMDLQIARKKRRLAQRDMAARMGVSVDTIGRLEKGDPGISLGTLSMAFLVLGSLNRFSEVMDPGSDDIGLLSEQQALPQRVRGKTKPKSKLTGNPLSITFGLDI